ncbi:DUF2517 family protein, partial [Aeromonas veronii]
MASGSSTKPHSHHVQKETAKAVSFFICLPQLLAPNTTPIYVLLVGILAFPVMLFRSDRARFYS